MAKSKAFERHLARAQNHKSTWTLSEINAYRACIHRQRHVDDAFELIMEVNEGGYSITPEQSEFGIQWLRNACFKADGSLRTSKLAKCFGLAERNVIRNFSHFTFEGVRYQQNPYSGQFSTTPIYRTHSENGDYFDYTMEFWGLPEVTFTSYLRSGMLMAVAHA